jgi:hypothetical protein
MKPAATPAADLGPRLTADIFDLLADMLRHRAGNRVDALATMQRLNAELLAALADKTRDDADQWLTVTEAAAATGVTPACIRQWIAKHDIGVFDRRTGIFHVSRRRLGDFLRRRHGRLPPRLAENFS